MAATEQFQGCYTAHTVGILYTFAGRADQRRNARILRRISVVKTLYNQTLINTFAFIDKLGTVFAYYTL